MPGRSIKLIFVPLYSTGINEEAMLYLWACSSKVKSDKVDSSNDGKLVHTVTDTPFLQEMREYMTRAFSDPKYAEQAAAVAA